MRRWIKFPNPVVFYEPVTKEPLLRDGEEDTLTFGDFLNLLMMNPLWSGNYSLAKAQDNILRLYEEAVANNQNEMMIFEEDYILLERSAREPKMLHIGPSGPQIIIGFGKHPSMARQFLPMQEAIINATSAIDRAMEGAKPIEHIKSGTLR